MYRNYKLTTYIHIPGPLAELSCSMLTYDIMIMFLLKEVDTYTIVFDLI